MTVVGMNEDTTREDVAVPDRDDWYVQMILEDPNWKPYWDRDTEILREWMQKGLIYELGTQHFDEEVRTRGMQWVRCSDPDQEAPMREKWMAVSGAQRLGPFSWPGGGGRTNPTSPLNSHDDNPSRTCARGMSTLQIGKFQKHAGNTNHSPCLGYYHAKLSVQYSMSDLLLGTQFLATQTEGIIINPYLHGYMFDTRQRLWFGIEVLGITGWLLERIEKGDDRRTQLLEMKHQLTLVGG